MILKPNLFKIQHSDLTPESGCLLISEPFLHEVYFQRAVILMIECELTGGMGLVLNKATNVCLNDLIEGLEHVAPVPVFCGGPVRRDRLFYLHTLGDLIPGAVDVGNGLYIDGDFNTVMAYLRSGAPTEGHIRFFVGYSGWDYDQLMQEIKEGAWIVAENRLDSLLDDEGNDFWQNSLKTLDKRFHQWLNYPAEPYLN
jgi:putative transcriptional regulator